MPKTHNFVETNDRHSGDTIFTCPSTHLRAIIRRDDDPLNPRTDYDNAGCMVCWHRRYNLGDPGLGFPAERGKSSPEFPTPESFRDWWNGNKDEGISAHGKGGLLLPLYLYDHSGLTISHGAFSCRWDSGQVGYHYITRETILKEWGGKSNRITKKMLASAKSCLEGELTDYDNYLRGDVYGIFIEGPPLTHGELDLESGSRETLDSCWGFSGSDYAESEALSMLTSAIQDHTQEIADAALRLTFATGAD